MDRAVEMEAGTDSQTGKDKTQIDGAQPSHSMDTEDQATDPVKDMGEPEGDTADVTESVSAEDDKGSIAVVEDLPSGSASPGHHAKSFITAPPGPYVKNTEQCEVHAESEASAIKESPGSKLMCQEFPQNIRYQRILLKKFYAAWGKEKFGIIKKPVSSIGYIFLPPELRGVRDCEELFTSADDFTSAYSQMASVFLLCANAYPKHAPACYTLAESCFNMAKITSRLISASWKLNHGFTMSSMRSGLKEISYPLLDLRSEIVSPNFWYLQLYSDVVEHVMTNKSFERDEEFQGDCKQPSAESQISPFISTLGEAEAILNKTLGQIRQLLQPEGNRPEQEKVSVSSSARDESQGAETEFEESEISKKLRGVKGRIKSFVGDIEVLGGLLMNLKISEC